jgi:hypothetical protein
LKPHLFPVSDHDHDAGASFYHMNFKTYLHPAFSKIMIFHQTDHTTC